MVITLKNLFAKNCMTLANGGKLSGGGKNVLGVLTSVWLEPYQRKQGRGAKRQRGRENKQECWEMGRKDQA